MILKCQTTTDAYDIIIERGAIHKVGEYLSLDRRVCVVTDSGVPAEYARTVAMQCADAVIHTIPQGEQSKTLQTMENICRTMLNNGFSRKDCVFCRLLLYAWH